MFPFQKEILPFTSALGRKIQNLAGVLSSTCCSSSTMPVVQPLTYVLLGNKATKASLQDTFLRRPSRPDGRLKGRIGPFANLAWIQRDRSAILTVGNHVITRNNRIGVSHDGHRTWYLTIKDVRQGDAGTYMCQINTEVAVSQVGHVSVVVPPYIKDDMSSRDVRLQEGANVILACSARGSPVPTIKWRREDGSEIQVNGTTAMLEVPGPLLQLAQVSRTDMDAYLCIATNGIPPSVSKRIQVEVKFLPTVYVPHQLVGVPLNQEVTIECYIEAWPPGLNYWKRPNGIEVLHSDNKYEVKEIPGSQKYKTHMLLTIKSVTKADIGEYNCIANNSQGGAEQVVRVAASDPMPPTIATPWRKVMKRKTARTGSPRCRLSTGAKTP
ncbi:putative lachesin-like isoform X7, partial [Penaeus vannamei]